MVSIHLQKLNYVPHNVSEFNWTVHRCVLKTAIHKEAKHPTHPFIYFFFFVIKKYVDHFFLSSWNQYLFIKYKPLLTIVKAAKTHAHRHIVQLLHLEVKWECGPSPMCPVTYSHLKPLMLSQKIFKVNLCIDITAHVQKKFDSLSVSIHGSQHKGWNTQFASSPAIQPNCVKCAFHLPLYRNVHERTWF